jgi:hypothetical protein
MQININLTKEQIKALLTEYVSIEEYCQRIVENRANRIIIAIVKDYAKGKYDIEGVTVDEQAVINSKLANKIVVQSDKLPDDVKQIIVRRANIKTMADKIKEQKAEFKEVI